MVAFGASQVVMPQAARFPFSARHRAGLSYDPDVWQRCCHSLRWEPSGWSSDCLGRPYPRAVPASALDVGPEMGETKPAAALSREKGNPLPDRGKLLQFKVSARWEPKTLPAQGATCRLPPAMPKPGRGTLSQ